MIAHAPVVSPHGVPRLSAHGVKLRREVGNGIVTTAVFGERFDAFIAVIDAVGGTAVHISELYDLAASTVHPASLRVIHMEPSVYRPAWDGARYDHYRLFDRLIKDRQWFGRVILDGNPSNTGTFKDHWDDVDAMEHITGMRVRRVPVESLGRRSAEPTGSDLSGVLTPLRFTGYYSIEGGEPVYTYQGKSIMSRNKNAGIDWVMMGGVYRSYDADGNVVPYAANLLTAPLPGVSSWS